MPRERHQVVILLHGIRTRGVWRGELSPFLCMNGFVPYPLDYGWFPAVRFVSKRQRKQKLEWLRAKYEEVRMATSTERPSIIAHSFGSLLVCSMLEKYDVLLDKVIVCG